MIHRPTDITNSPIVMGKWYWAKNRTGQIAGTGKFAAIISKPDDITFFINGVGYDPGGFTFVACNPQPEMVFGGGEGQGAVCSECEGAGQCETYPPGNLADSFTGAGDPVSYMDECNNCGGKGIIEAPPADPERCPECGYTEQNAREAMDHRRCSNYGKAPWSAAVGENLAEPEHEPTNPAEIQYVPGTWYVYKPMDGQTRTFYKTPKKMTIPHVELREAARDADGNEIPSYEVSQLREILAERTLQHATQLDNANRLREENERIKEEVERLRAEIASLRLVEKTLREFAEAMSTGDLREWEDLHGLPHYKYFAYDAESALVLAYGKEWQRGCGEGDSHGPRPQTEPESPPSSPDLPPDPRYGVFVLSQFPSGLYALELLGIQPTQSVANSLAADAAETWGTYTVLPVWTRKKQGD